MIFKRWARGKQKYISNIIVKVNISIQVPLKSLLLFYFTVNENSYFVRLWDDKKIVTHLECIPFVNYLVYCWMTDSNFSENGLITRLRLIGSNNCIFADVIPPWHCVNAYLTASKQLTDKTSAFMEMVTLSHDQIVMMCLGCIYLIWSLGKKQKIFFLIMSWYLKP